MKISKINLDGVKNYLRVYDDKDDDLILLAMSAAKKLIADYTGISDEKLDDYPDLSIAFYCLCSDMYDSRYFAGNYQSYNNPTVDIILNMHRRNLL